jgi:hypothetical protein
MASTASCAKVSALDSRVGRPSTPASLARRLRPGGMAGLPLTALTRAPPSPDTNLSGTSTTRTRAFSSGSAMAASATDRLTSPSGPVPATPTTISFPPRARHARSAPPRDEVGRPEQEHLVLGAAGFTLGPVDEDHRLAPAGGGRIHDCPDLAGEGERGAAAAPQVDPLDHLDQLPGVHPPHRAEDLLMCVQVNAGVPVETRGQAGLRDAHHLRQRAGIHRIQPRWETSPCG